MNIGVSTACLYPLSTKEAIHQLLAAGFQDIEIFINTESEETLSFARECRRIANDYGASITAIHPYTSGLEPYLLFSTYEQRFKDWLSHYRTIYEAAAEMGAPYVILHGDRIGGPLNEQQVLDRYEQLYDEAAAYGVTLLQENVVHYRSSQPAFIQAMRDCLGEKAQFVLDIKQCKRSGIAVSTMLETMGNAIRHVHISDHRADLDCVIPGKGDFDFAWLFSYFKKTGYTGSMMLELYRNNFSSILDLKMGADNLNKCRDLFEH